MAKAKTAPVEEVEETNEPHTVITEGEWDDDGNAVRYPIAAEGFVGEVEAPVYTGVTSSEVPRDHETLNEALKEADSEYYTDELLTVLNLNDKQFAYAQANQEPPVVNYDDEEADNSGYVLNPIAVETPSEDDEEEVVVEVKPFLDEVENVVTNPVASDEEIAEREENTPVSAEPIPVVTVEDEQKATEEAEAASDESTGEDTGTTEDAVVEEAPEEEEEA